MFVNTKEENMMNCSSCGNMINPGDNVCSNCGAPVVNNIASNPTPLSYTGVPYQPQVPISNYDPSMDYTPISMWGYFGYEILFSIPCIGLICLLIFSFGGTKNINLRNFARSYFCVLIIIAICTAILFALGGLSMFTLGNAMYSNY